MLRLLAPVFFISLMACQWTWADEIEEALKEAETAYQKQQYALSLERLEQAMNLIKDVQAANIIQFFPKPLKGWEITDGEKHAASAIPNVQVGVFSSVIRRYSKKSAAGVSVNLLDKDDANEKKTESKKSKEPWIQFTLVQKPNSLITMAYQGVMAIRGSNPDVKRVDVDGYEGVLLCQTRKTTCDMYFDFDGNYMLMLNSEYVSEAEVTEYAKAFDVDGLVNAN